MPSNPSIPPSRVQTHPEPYDPQDPPTARAHPSDTQRLQGIPAPADRRVQPHTRVGRQACERRGSHGGQESGETWALIPQIRLAVRIGHVQSRAPLGHTASRAESCVLRHLLRPRAQALHRLAQHVRAPLVRSIGELREVAAEVACGCFEDSSVNDYRPQMRVNDYRHRYERISECT